jgi:ATP-dependent protease ClpP protease subunit
MSKEEVEKIMLSRQDYYIDAEKALQLGIVDKIIGS